MQEEDYAAWQAFCEASVRVLPTKASTVAVAVPVLEDVQGHVLYQHRLPQLADRMQHLLSETGKAWQHHVPGMLLPACQFGPPHRNLLHVSCFDSQFVSHVSHFMMPFPWMA